MKEQHLWGLGTLLCFTGDMYMLFIMLIPVNIGMLRYNAMIMAKILP